MGHKKIKDILSCPYQRLHMYITNGYMQLEIEPSTFIWILGVLISLRLLFGKKHHKG